VERDGIRLGGGRGLRWFGDLDIGHAKRRELGTVMVQPMDVEGDGRLRWNTGEGHQEGLQGIESLIDRRIKS
jgi:hypothetical protein